MPIPERPIPEINTNRRESSGERAMTAEQLRGYRQWKTQVPLEIRSLVEGKLLGKKVRLDQQDLPSAVEFYRGIQQVLEDPKLDPSTLDL